MKYQLTIKNTETGETVLDENTDCVILAAHGEEHTSATMLSYCGSLGIIEAYHAVLSVLEEIDKKSPELAGLAQLYKKVGNPKVEQQNQN